MKFTEWNFDPRIQQGIADMGFEECTPVQAETFQLIMEGKDIQAQSQTGTGKTAAFMIGAFHLLLTDESLKGRKVLVVAPTRELADQIEKEALALGKHLDFTIGSFYGGVGYKKQEDLLRNGVDIVIGTPGRLLDFSKSKKLDFSDVGILVIDEADRMFDMGFYPDIRKILEKMGPKEERKSLLYSATMSSRVATLAWEFMHEPGDILIEPESVTVDKISQELYHISKEEKTSLLLGLLAKEKPQNAIIFTNTKHDAVKLSKRLNINGYRAEFIIGDLAQKKRLKIIEEIKAGTLPYLVATDVAARGLHVNDLDLVVNYDIPNEAENYVHRIGRTARAGAEGKAISLACEKYVFGLKDIEDYIEMKIPVTWPSDDDFAVDKSSGMSISGDHKDREIRGRDRDFRGGRGGGRDRGRGGRDRSDRDGKRELIPRGKRKRSQDLVSQATGASAMEEEKTKGNNPGNTERKSRRNRGGNRDRGRNRGGHPGVSTGGKPDLPPPNIQRGSMEDRLAYYKKKYGDDFKALESQESNPEKSDSKKSGRRRRGRGGERKPEANQEKSSAKTSRQGSNRGPKKTGGKPQATKNEQKGSDQKAPQKEKKKGIFSKLFGWMSGNKKEKN